MRDRKSIKHQILGMLLLLVGCFVCMGTATSRAAEGTYISEVTIRSGESATEDLTKAGYTVLYPAVASDTWIGYRTSASDSGAITDICLGGNGQREINDRTIPYEKISGQIAGHSLFYTRSSEAGEPLMGLHFVTGGGDEDVMPLMNNGAETVRRTDGEIMRINAGTDKGYLIQIKKDVWKPYVSDIAVVNADSKKEALMQLGALGCDYYIDEKVSSSGCTMIGYTKTDNERESITDAVIIEDPDRKIDGYEQVSEEKVLGGYLYISRDSAVGNPLLDVDVFEDPEKETITESDWTQFASANGNTGVVLSYYGKDDSYNRMSQNKNLCEVTPSNLTESGESLGLVVISGEEGLEAKKEVRNERLEAGSESEAEDDTEEGEKEDGESVEDNTSENPDEDVELNPQVETDEPKEAEETEDFTQPDETEVNTDVVGAVEEPEIDESDIEDVGTVVDGQSRSFPLWLMIVLIIVGILIPIVTIITKKMIDKSGISESKE